jgi:hypothetical protein
MGFLYALGAAGAAVMLLSACTAPSSASDEGSSAALSTGNGLKGQYFSGMAFNTPALTRTDATINFNWADSPGTGVASDQFSVRWTGQVEALYSEVYTFYTQSDDGVRLWVNGQQLVNNWTDHAFVENRGSIALTAGQRYALTMEFYDNASAAIAVLSWSGAHTAKQVIPQAQLYATVPKAGCGTANESAAVTLVCPTGQSIATVAFASYGTPRGSCGSFVVGTCNAATSASVLSNACVGKASCKVTANNATFGDPCPSTAKRLFAQVTCSVPDSSSDGGADSGNTSGSEDTGAAGDVSGSEDTGAAGDVSGSGGTVATAGASGNGAAAGSGGTVATAGASGNGAAAGSGSTSGTAGSGGVGGTASIAGSSGTCNSASTIQLIGNRILDTSGKQIVARGPEMVAASTDLTSGIDTAAAMGANAARLLLTIDAANSMTPTTFDTIVGRAVSHNMLVWISLYTWDGANNNPISSALGGGNFYSLQAPAGTGTCSKDTPSPCYLAVWSRQWLKDLIAKYKGHVIVDAMQEYIGVADPSSEAGRTEWAGAAQSNIRWFRSAGYLEPLEVMSNFQGRDLYAIVEKGTSIRAVDPLVVGGYPQTMFGWQAYWADSWYKGWQGGLLLGGTSTITGTQAVHQFAVTQQFPIEIGFDNYPGDTSAEYKAQLDQAATDNASWLWWSWTGSNTVECPNDGATCQTYVTTGQTGFAGAVRSTCGL